MVNNNEVKELEREVARLESINDLLLTEVQQVHGLLQRVGFEKGLETLKETALEWVAIGVE